MATNNREKAKYINIPVYFGLAIERIMNTDALSGLAQLENESVDCIITSPPYLGLRTYGVGMIWDDHPNCDHKWGEEIKHVYSKSTIGKKWTVGATPAQMAGRRGEPSKFCIKCNAWKGELGQEPVLELYVEHLMLIFNECRRVLKKRGTCFVVMGDTYNGDKKGYTYGKFADGRKVKQAYQKGDIYNHQYHKKPVTGIQIKSLLMVPARFAIAMTEEGWILRNDIIWRKPNAIPSSVKDRYTVNYEHIFFFSKSKNYNFHTQYVPYKTHENRPPGIFRANNWNYVSKYANTPYYGKGRKEYEEKDVQNPSDVKRRILASMKKNMPPIGGLKQAGGQNSTYSGNTPPWGEKGANERAVWDIKTRPSPIKHYATFPETLVRKMLNTIKGLNGLILDPFAGVGTVAVVAHKMNFDWIMIEPSAEYCGYIQQRLDSMVTYLLKNI